MRQTKDDFDDFSEQNEDILADVLDHTIMTRNQSQLSATAKPKAKARPKPKPKAQSKAKSWPTTRVYFAPQILRGASKAAEHNPSPTTGAPPACVGCDKPLHPSMAVFLYPQGPDP